MTTVGLIGGLGPESTIDYYRRILQAWGRNDPSSAPSLVIDSLDVQRAMRLIEQDRSAVTEYLLGSLRRLAAAGADFAAITANTPHIVFDALAARSPIRMVSIVETCAAEARRRGMRRLGLLGTRFTMEGSFYPAVCARQNMAVVLPSETERAWVHERYVGELLEGQFREDTRQDFIAIVTRLRDQERIDGIVLGGLSCHCCCRGVRSGAFRCSIPRACMWRPWSNVCARHKKLAMDEPVSDPLQAPMVGMSRSLTDRAADHAYAYLSTIHARAVRATLGPDELRSRLGGPLPLEGADPLQVIDMLADAGRGGTVASQGPRYFGFVTGGSIPTAIAADWLVSAWDQNAQMFVMSPISAVVEQIVAGWLTDLFGLPATWSVGFVTGAQMANFTALLVARHQLLRQAGWDVERDGLFGAPSIAVVVSDESHRTIFTALRMLGLGAERVRRVETDGHGRVRLDRLDETLGRESGPCLVCTQIGNVNTGAADPIREVAALTRERGAWLHVDGAFGLWAATSPSRRHLAVGIDQADSIATDGHKWLNVPYDCGIVFTAHPEEHQRALLVPAHYIQATPGERDPRAFTPEESRRARALPMYAALRALGRDGVGKMVERCCNLAQRMALLLAEHEHTRILNDVVLNQVLVQFRPPGSDDAAAAALTQSVITRVQEDGTCWVGGTKWKGQTAMRVSISNWCTTADDIDRSAGAILRALDGGTAQSWFHHGTTAGRP